MTQKKSTRRAFVISAISVLICLTMLIGTTFAWFTDTATTGTNIIKSGNLDVAMYYADGTKNPASVTWADAEGKAIFNYDLWEPGYTVAKHIKISNDGNLALKYQVSFMLDGAVGDLAEVIDVYFIDPAKQVEKRSDISNLTSVGTLDKFLSGGAIFGDLEAGKSNQMTVILKMQETANNDYKSKSVGENLTILVNATQDTVESDSYNNQYDKLALLPDEKLVVSGNDDLTAAIEGQVDYIVADGTYSKTVVADAVNVTINGGTYSNQVIAARNGGTVVINDATAGSAASGGGPNIIANITGGSTVVIKDGSYMTSVMFAGDGTGTAIIEGGNFDCGALYYTYVGKAVANLTITGGTFSSMMVIAQGLIGPNIADFVPDTHTIVNNADGSITVVEK